MQDLVLWPGIKPGPFALGVWSLSHWTIKEFPHFLMLNQVYIPRIKSYWLLRKIIILSIMNILFNVIFFLTYSFHPLLLSSINLSNLLHGPRQAMLTADMHVYRLFSKSVQSLSLCLFLTYTHPYLYRGVLFFCS